MIDLFERVAGEEIDVVTPCRYCGLPSLDGEDACEDCADYWYEPDYDDIDDGYYPSQEDL